MSLQIAQVLVGDSFAQGAIHQYFDRKNVIIQQYSFQPKVPLLPDDLDRIMSQVVIDTINMTPHNDHLINGFSIVLYPWASLENQLRYAILARKVFLSEEVFAPQWSPVIFDVSESSIPINDKEILVPPGHYEGPPNKGTFSSSLEYELLALDLLESLQL